MDRRSADSRFFALLARGGIPPRRPADFFRQAVCSRLSGEDPVAEDAAGARTAPRRGRSNARQVSGGLSPPDRARTGLAGPAPESKRSAESAIVKDQLEGLVSQMVERGILFDEAVGEFEKRFIKR